MFIELDSEEHLRNEAVDLPLSSQGKQRSPSASALQGAALIKSKTYRSVFNYVPMRLRKTYDLVPSRDHEENRTDLRGERSIRPHYALCGLLFEDTG